MADGLKIKIVEKVVPQVSPVPSHSKRKKRKNKQKDEASKHFRELVKTAENAHRILSEKKSPYRFCIYREKEDVFIDVALVDFFGKIKEIFKRNITHDEFHSWIKLIEDESGLIVDRKI